MALKDILEKLAADAAAEAEAILAEAEAQAEALRTQARSQADAAVDALERRAARDTAEATETIAAQARLAARDASLVARRSLLAEARASLESRVMSLPADELAELLAPRIAAEARAGERVAIGGGLSGEAREALAEALVALGVERGAITESASAAPVVRVEGDRMGAEVSVASLLAERAERIEEILLDELFGEGMD